MERLQARAIFVSSRSWTTPCLQHRCVLAPSTNIRISQFGRHSFLQLADGAAYPHHKGTLILFLSQTTQRHSCGERRRQGQERRRGYSQGQQCGRSYVEDERAAEACCSSQLGSTVSRRLRTRQTLVSRHLSSRSGTQNVLHVRGPCRTRNGQRTCVSLSGRLVG